MPITTFIELENIRFFAYHGVMPQENVVGNEYEVNLRVAVDFTRALSVDNLKLTINYAELYDLVKKEMESPSHLIEHLAGRILFELQREWPQITQILLKVSKLNPPIIGQVEKSSVIIDWKAD